MSVILHIPNFEIYLDIEKLQIFIEIMIEIMI